MPDEPAASAQLSPLMRQYWDIKSQNTDALLFFRVGDFYEMFDADAHVASRELDITLTSRPEPSYPNGRMPMAGVPARAADLYLGRLVAKGYSVAICEQVGIVGAEKGPVERQVTRILTPGTVLESHLLPQRENNYLLSLVKGGDLWGLACVDASCGEFFVTQLSEEQLILEVGRLEPKEILVAKKMVKPGPNEVMPREVLEVPQSLLASSYRFTGRPGMFFQFEPAQRRILQTFGVATLEGFGCQSLPLAVSAAGAALEYLEKTQAAEMPKFAGISAYTTDGHLTLDSNTRRNLELTETSRDRGFDGSLLWTLDQTRSGMGSRMLRKWLLKPLYSVPAIWERQDAVAELSRNAQQRDEIGNALARLSDVERLSVKLTSATVCPRDLMAIQCSIDALEPISKAVKDSSNPYLSSLQAVPAKLTELAGLISRAIAPEPPRELTEGGIFADGYNAEIDEIRALLGGGKQWIEDFQRQEQERTGIKSLKVNFNRNFGYFIEITNSNKQNAPADYIRKQTLTNAERFITPELKEYEAKILNAEKNQNDVEYKLFLEFRQSLVQYGQELLHYATRLASLDALLSLAQVAVERKYVRPTVDDSLTLDIKQGRHPVLEKILPMGKYVANDTRLEGDSEDHQLIILTGPNMSGKSSLLRQVAHIVILSQMGSFVPAESAHVGVVDRIFTRIGAVDDLTQGQSTFLVEMAETTQCCLSATPRSLILLDEVGRGTSTYDGVAIAWSVAEYLARDVRARTIFATHYHELNGLASFFPQIENYQVLVRELDGHVEFIRSVVPGGASRSYGVQVARMAGLPASVIDRAQYLMGQMEKKGAAAKILDGPKFRNIPMDEVMQLSLFEPKASDRVDNVALMSGVEEK
ncbi:MAG: DNA mismatch repair protein MutS [Cyanobacteria bacterium SZAS LIN-5]|nr:DNA mismatch repair protein MutS [Cyanobacteria bacterium SZAS LIN-5]RTL46154.1 MAG: DNA mismatch repair protein MutS [Candidatus Melainabacteria bacterium]